MSPNEHEKAYDKLFMAYEECRSDNTAHVRKILELQQQIADYEKALKEIYAGDGLIPIDGKVSREQTIAFKALDKYTEQI